MIAKDQFKMMKRTVYLISPCRGGVVDEEALILALKTGEIAGAGLDVFVKEPFPSDHPLVKLDNVVLTCHIGGGSGTGRAVQAQELRILIEDTLS